MILLLLDMIISLRFRAGSASCEAPVAVAHHARASAPVPRRDPPASPRARRGRRDVPVPGCDTAGTYHAFPEGPPHPRGRTPRETVGDRKSTRLDSSHLRTSY